MEEYNIDILKNDFTVLSGIVKIMKECLVPIVNKTQPNGKTLEILFDFKYRSIESTAELMEKRLSTLCSIIDNIDDEKLKIVYPDIEMIVDTYIEIISNVWQFVINSLDKNLCDEIVNTLREENIKIYRDYHDKISQTVIDFLKWDL